MRGLAQIEPLTRQLNCIPPSHAFRLERHFEPINPARLRRNSISEIPGFLLFSAINKKIDILSL